MLNDDSPGRALDILHKKGENEIFAQVAPQALLLYGIAYRCIHLDTSSLNVEGEYEWPQAPGVIHITHGCTLERQPDPKQVVGLLTTYRSVLPVWIQALDGNTNEKLADPPNIKLKPVHCPILRLLGPNVEKCYHDTGQERNVGCYRTFWIIWESSFRRYIRSQLLAV